MKVLVISNWYPYPADNGARLRVYNLLRQTSKRHRVYLLSFHRQHVDASSIRHMEQICEGVELVPFDPVNLSGMLPFLKLFHITPRAITMSYSPEMAHKTSKILDAYQPDLAIAIAIEQSGGMAHYLRSYNSIPRILEDLELSALHDRMMSEKKWVRKLRLNLNWLKLKPHIRGLLQDLDGCTVVSQKEKFIVEAVAPGYHPIGIVPNGIDVETYSDEYLGKENHSLIFPGALTYEANYLAMEYFLREIYPLIHEAIPGVKLYITGSTKGVALDGLDQAEGVIFTGYVSDVRERIARSQVCVVPMTVGGGSRLKILEAMALRTAVVSTSKGAEGINVTPGRDILLADEPMDFADKVIGLLQSSRDHQDLVNKARMLLVTIFVPFLRK